MSTVINELQNLLQSKYILSDQNRYNILYQSIRLVGFCEYINGLDVDINKTNVHWCNIERYIIHDITSQLQEPYTLDILHQQLCNMIKSISYNFSNFEKSYLSSQSLATLSHYNTLIDVIIMLNSITKMSHVTSNSDVIHFTRTLLSLKLYVEKLYDNI